MSEELYKQMAQSILDGEEDVAAELAQKALEAGIDPLAAITDGYMPGVNEVGDSFACGQAFLPELVMAGEAMKAAIAVLEPAMQEGGGLQGVFGWLVGTGPGAGMSLLFLFAGGMGVLVGGGGYLVPVVRNAEDILPDHEAAAETG